MLLHWRNEKMNKVPLAAQKSFSPWVCHESLSRVYCLTLRKQHYINCLVKAGEIPQPLGADWKCPNFLRFLCHWHKPWSVAFNNNICADFSNSNLDAAIEFGKRDEPQTTSIYLNVQLFLVTDYLHHHVQPNSHVDSLMRRSNVSAMTVYSGYKQSGSFCFGVPYFHS